MGNRSPHRLTPAHFDKEADREVMWKDVTLECKNFLEEHKELEKVHRIVYQQLEYLLNTVHLKNEMKSNVIEMMKKIDPAMGERFEAMQKEVYEKKKIHFWDQ